MVDVHASPYRPATYSSANIGNQRFDMRDATLLDMISLAYDREDDASLGGPTWIGFDRFDVVAKIILSEGYPRDERRPGEPPKRRQIPTRRSGRC